MGTIEIPWGAWYETKPRRLSFPDRFELFVPPFSAGPDLGAEEIRKALESPVGSPTLAELAARTQSGVAVAVDDLTRPTPAGRFLPWVLDTVEEAGFSPEDIAVVVATGAHRSLQRSDLLKKTGARGGGQGGRLQPLPLRRPCGIRRHQARNTHHDKPVVCRGGP